MSKQKYKYLVEKKGPKSYANVSFVIIVFLLVFPLFAVNLRYQLGSIFSIIFNYIGNMCFTFGAFLMTLCIVSIFVGRSIKVKGKVYLMIKKTILYNKLIYSL
ncbi:MAG: hypothetical protein E3J52_00560 [Promethearchaeota archaeon]|nr:MAG: hypothetical protein E3J52_00560 [Candidatus Lokiarchaeota archaeon]